MLREIFYVVVKKRIHVLDEDLNRGFIYDAHVVALVHDVL